MSTAPTSARATAGTGTGAGIRGPLAWPPVPAMASRAEQFDDLVLDARDPPGDPRRDRARRGRVRGRGRAARRARRPGRRDGVPLGRLFASHGKVPARIVVYRRPVETRAKDRRELVALVNDVVVEQVAAMLEVDPHELDPGYETGEP